jgi:cytochrome b
VPTSAARRTRVWDLPTRLFHWSLAALVTASWLSGQFGGQPWLEWHFRCGYAILALLLFRLLWGFAGDRYARFASFPPSWRLAREYLQAPHRTAGHNPLGALSVYALLAATGVQVVSGLFASDGDFTEGPWARFVPEAGIELAATIHRINRWILLALVVLHLAAIAWHSLARRELLVRGMVSGDREGVEVEAAADDTPTRLRALLLLALSAALAGYLVTL